MTHGVTYTQEEYRALLAQGNVREVGSIRVKPAALAARGLPPLPVPSPAKIDRYRSKTERRYAELLTHWQHEGEVLLWYYEPIKLWLAPQTTITIDFLVVWVTRPRDYELHEVKGSWIREDGWQKLKFAAAMYPIFPMYLAQWKDNTWTHKRVPAV